MSDTTSNTINIQNVQPIWTLPSIQGDGWQINIPSSDVNRLLNGQLSLEDFGEDQAISIIKCWSDNAPKTILQDVLREHMSIKEED